MSDYDAMLEDDIRKARAKQPLELRERTCRICGPFMLSSCPAAPKHYLRPKEPQKTMELTLKLLLVELNAADKGVKSAAADAQDNTEESARRLTAAQMRKFDVHLALSNYAAQLTELIEGGRA